MSTPVKSQYIPTLDGWRALAILAVITSHAGHSLGALGLSDSVVKALSWGRLGVDLFFAISGFLICNRLIQEFQSRGEISLKNFYLRRSFRILPLYLFYLAALFALSRFAGVPASNTEIGTCLIFCRNYVNPPLGTYTNHFWSLSVEEHFYLLWPFFLVQVGTRRALWITPAIALFVHGWRSFDSHFHPLASILPSEVFLWRTDTRIDALLWGCFAALICFDRAFRFPAISPVLILGALVGAIQIHFPAIPLVFALLFPLLIVSTVSNPTSAISKFLELPPLRWIGRLSYSLYVWQTLFLQSNLEPDPKWLSTLKLWPINICMIVLLATTTHYFLERPLIRLGHHLSSGRSLLRRRPLAEQNT